MRRVCIYIISTIWKLIDRHKLKIYEQNGRPTALVVCPKRYSNVFILIVSFAIISVDLIPRKDLIKIQQNKKEINQSSDQIK